LSFALGFSAGGRRHDVALRGPEEGWTRRSADGELEWTLAAIKLGVWQPPRPKVMERKRDTGERLDALVRRTVSAQAGPNGTNGVDPVSVAATRNLAGAALS
jgi:hypothetical protein